MPSFLDRCLEQRRRAVVLGELDRVVRKADDSYFSLLSKVILMDHDITNQDLDRVVHVVYAPPPALHIPGGEEVRGEACGDGEASCVISRDTSRVITMHDACARHSTPSRRAMTSRGDALSREEARTMGGAGSDVELEEEEEVEEEEDEDEEDETGGGRTPTRKRER